MPNPVCVTCRIEFKPEENGIFVEQETDDGPYKIWHADLYQCPDCGVQIITGWGNRELAVRHEQEKFKVLQKEVTHRFDS